MEKNRENRDRKRWKEEGLSVSFKKDNIWANLRETMQLDHTTMWGMKILGKAAVRANWQRKEYLTQQKDSEAKAEK